MILEGDPHLLVYRILTALCRIAPATPDLLMIYMRESFQIFINSIQELIMKCVPPYITRCLPSVDSPSQPKDGRMYERVSNICVNI